MFEKETAEYYADNAKKLHRVIDGILSRYRFPCTDKDDFYSIGNQTFAQIIKVNKYDNSLGSFDGFLYNSLLNALKMEMRRRNAYKRTADRFAVSIDMPVTEDGFTIGDTLSSEYRVENDVLSGSDRVEAYLSGLSAIQRKIVEMKMDGYSMTEIMSVLNLTKKKYYSEWKEITSFENTLVLRENDSTDMEDGNMENNNNAQQTMSKSKPDRLSVASISKKIHRHTIRFDHPLQRSSDQWTPVMKSNLISDILQGNPVPQLIFAEQVINGTSIIWDLDGKQRCTNVHAFIHDEFRISRNIRRWMISYQVPVKKDGKEIFDEKGIPLYEWKECDIRGRKFSALPEELQDKITDYNFEIVQYINCTSEDIAYHIVRYNDGRPMSVSQKGLTRLGEQSASLVKSIASMPFFKDYGDYKRSEFRNGTIDRVITESIMAVNYIDDWKKKTEDLCGYICENCTESDFDEFEGLAIRLTEAVKDSEKACEMFNSKDTFLWFGLFARFQELGLEDSQYIRFLENFGELRSMEINGVTYDSVDSKSTKDKNVVIKKMKQLTAMMNNYFETDSAKCA